MQVLDYDAFKEIMTRRFASEDKNQELNEAFRAFDPDGNRNGMIDIEEFRDALLNLCDMLDEKQIDEMCNELEDEETPGSFFYPKLVEKMMSLKKLD